MTVDDLVNCITMVKNHEDSWERGVVRSRLNDPIEEEKYENYKDLDNPQEREKYAPKPPMFSAGRGIKREFGAVMWNDEGKAFYEKTKETWSEAFGDRNTWLWLVEGWNKWVVKNNFGRHWHKKRNNKSVQCAQNEHDEDLDDDDNTGVINLPGDDEFIDYKKQPWREGDYENIHDNDITGHLLDRSDDVDNEEDGQNTASHLCKQLFRQRRNSELESEGDVDEENGVNKNYKGENDGADNENGSDDGSDDDMSECKEKRLSTKGKYYRNEEEEEEDNDKEDDEGDDDEGDDDEGDDEGEDDGDNEEGEDEGEEEEKQEPVMIRKKTNKRVGKETYSEDEDNDEYESEAVTTRSKNSRTQNEVPDQRKIQNKPNKLASAKVAKSKATKKVRKANGGTKKKRKRSGKQ
jgi:hypothetical protein